MKNVLIVSREEKYAIAAQGAADGESELMLLVGGFKSQFRIARVELTIPQIIEGRPVQLVGSGFGHDI